MHIDFILRGSFHSKGADILQRLAKKSVEEFFRYFDGKPHIELTVFKAGPGGDKDNLIKLSKSSPDTKCTESDGLPVTVYTEGTQCLTATLRLKGKTFDQVSQIICQGPYRRKAKFSRDSEVPVLVAAATPSLVGPSVVDRIVALADSNHDDIPIIKIKEDISSPPPELPAMPRLSPREKLENAGRGEEIERIKATLASILVEFHTGSLDEIDNTLKVPVSLITRAIYGHMKLVPNDSGTYRGIVASFYSSTISLFGFKDSSADVSVDEDAKYADWIMDGLLIIDFVGGKDKLAYLAHERKREVEALAREAAKPKEKPPTAQTVETVLREGFFKDAEVLDMVVKMLGAKDEAEGKAALALEEERVLNTSVARLESELEEARRNLAEATFNRMRAEENVTRFQLPEETMENIRAIKARFDSLMKQLGV